MKHTAVFFCLLSMPLYAKDTSIIQNATLEGLQLSSEQSKEPGEKIVTCYFIFRNKPSSYFYEIRKKTKKLVFEFNDAQEGTAPISSQKEDPISGFQIEQKKIDANKEVRGLNQEWHDLITVSFDLSQIPQITVSDEFNVISFTYKWSTDPLKIAKYEVKEKKNNAILWSSGAVTALGAGILVYQRLTQKHDKPAEPLSIDDLPDHHR